MPPPPLLIPAVRAATLVAALVPALLLGALLPSALAAQTITVDSSSALSDFGGAQLVADLPGPDGRVTFYEALQAADNTPGPQTIAFAVPMAEYDDLYDAFMLHMPNFTVELFDDGTTIDGTTQTDFAGDVNPDSAEIGIYGEHPGSSDVAALILHGNDNVIKGIGRIRWRGTLAVVLGDRNVFQGNTLFGAFFSAIELRGNDNLVGGTGPGEGNTLSAGDDGLLIVGPAARNVVVGNTMITGGDHGVVIFGGATDNRIGGGLPGEGNVISGAGHSGEQGFPVGGQVFIQGGDGTVIQGNMIGPDATGSVDITASGSFGIRLRDAQGTVIGGPDPGMGNVISGHAGPFAKRYGIQVQDGSADMLIQGNLIGTDATGTVPMPNEVGVECWLFSIFEPLPRDVDILGNRIAHHQLTGISVIGDCERIRMQGNEIFGNGEIGIDLVLATEIPYLPSANDPLDLDGGPNGLQNFPVLHSAHALLGQVVVEGLLDSTPDGDYELEFFANTTADPSGHGEGERFLGGCSVTTDATGQAAFLAVLDAAAGPGELLSATATDALGNSSEFSEVLTVLGGEDWVDLGQGLAGATGVPQLVGSGELLPGASVSVAASGAASAAPAGLVAGSDVLGAPFKGGTLVPVPELVVTGLMTDATGALVVSTVWPAGVPAGTGLVVQVWIQDGAAPKGWAATNAVARVTP